MVRKILLSVITTVAFCAMGFAQSRPVSGVVTSEDGSPVLGVVVTVQGTTNSSVTDAAGRYTVSAPASGTLEFSFFGMETVSMPVQGRSVIDAVMIPDATNIDDVIVVAFGTTTKEAFTGSATVLKAEDIAKFQQSNIAQTLAGTAVGVQVANSSGQPGSNPSIRIRGFGSINAENTPLWIVDGQPYDGDLNNLNPNDVESMTILKDAASNALYGARGANGVIMITTKRAQTKNATITVDVKWGVNSRALQSYEYIDNPALYYEMHYGALKNSYMASGYGESAAHMLANQNVAAPANNGGLGYQVFDVPDGQAFIGSNGKVNPNAILGNRITHNDQEYLLLPDNWEDAAYRSSLRQEYNVSVNGGDERSSFYASFGYLNNQGITANSNMKRYTARLKADYQAKKWLKVGANMNYSNFASNRLTNEGESSSSGNLFAYVSTVAPIYPLYVRDGNGNIMTNSSGITLYDHGDGMNAGLSRSLFPGSNGLASTILNTNGSEGNAFNGNGFFDISVFENSKHKVNFTFNIGASLDETRSTTVQNPYFGQFASQNGTIGKQHSRDFAYNTQQILNYTAIFGDKHNFSAMVGHEFYDLKNYLLYASKSNMFSQKNQELNGAVIDQMGANSSITHYNNEGYFGRVMYDYDSKYFFSGSYRRDASSRFAPANRWGDFWSAGASWLISKENFMARSASWLDMLKVKFSIGSQGNDKISNYLYQDRWTIENSNGDLSVVWSGRGNKDITWETNVNMNAGIEFSVLEDRITGGIDYFNRKTTDMLFTLPMATSMGFGSYYANVGDMLNRGVEVELNFVPVRAKNVEWNVSLNLTHLRNKIAMLPEERKTLEVDGYKGYVSGTSYYGEGLPLYTFYNKKYAGVSEDGRSMWYKDVKNDDGSVTRETTTTYSEGSDYLCGDPIPDLYGGFSTSVAFFGFDLSVIFGYQIGGLAYDSGYAASMTSPLSGNTGSNWHKDILNSWTPENSGSAIPRLQYGDQNSTGRSDRFLTDASYLNIQNINFGYTLPSKFTERLGVNRLRVYLSCENVHYWSHRKGFDPRYSYTGTTTSSGYSPIRTISGGINIQF